MFDSFVAYYSVSVIAASALYVGWQLRNHADGVQRVLTFGLVWGCGPRLFGYSLLDEIVLTVVSAYMVLFRRRELWTITNGLRQNPVYWMPTVFCLFLACHSLVSLFVLNDPRMVKWTIVFAATPFMIALLPRWLSGRDALDRVPSRFVSVHIYLYFTAYIFQGVLGEFFIGDWGRFHTQEIYWQGSSLAVMPVMVLFATCFFFPEQYLGRWQDKLFLGFILSLCSFFFDSRILQLLLICAPVAGLFLYWKGYRHWIAMLASFACCFLLNVTIVNKDIDIKRYAISVWEEAPPEVAKGYLSGTQKLPIIDALEEGVVSLTKSANLVKPLENDIDRKVQLEAGVELVTRRESTLQALFGTGFYTHRYEIVDIMQNKYAEARLGSVGLPSDVGADDKARPVFRTTAMTGYITDTGILGLVLFGMVLLSAAYFAMYAGVKTFLSGGICMSIALAWTYSNYSFENVLWFLLAFIVTGICKQSADIAPKTIT